MKILGAPTIPTSKGQLFSLGRNIKIGWKVKKKGGVDLDHYLPIHVLRDGCKFEWLSRIMNLNGQGGWEGRVYVFYIPGYGLICRTIQYKANSDSACCP